MEAKENSRSKQTQEPIKQQGDKLGSSVKAENTKEKKEKEVSDGQNQKSEDIEKEKDFWEDARENVSEGAKVVGETVSEYAQTIGDKAKEAFKSGSEFTMEMVHQAQEIIDSYKHKQEIKRLSDARDELLAELGKHMYRTVKSNNHTLPGNYLEETNVQSLIGKIENIDKEIIKINEQEKENK